ncbi:MAG: polyprenyl synthetase family protein, partial [Phycisphaerales bacterium]
AHVTCGAVVEMIHMATLVHDDVLDEADTRRRGETVNRLHGNEAAVMLGDYLIASAYHLCSQLDSPKTSLRVAQVAMTLCAGELLQLSHREDFSLDEATYFEVIDRKTGALVALSCGLGATFAGADERTVARLERFGRKIGLAFQIQDDLLDLTGRQAALGKPVGKDMEKGKLTLPMIHHLAAAPPQERGRSLRLMEAATGGGGDGPGAADAAGALVHALVASGSLAHARETAERMIAEAKAELAPLPAGPARETLLSMADAVLNRSS